jgi:hypothetical protein
MPAKKSAPSAVKANTASLAREQRRAQTDSAKNARKTNAARAKLAARVVKLRDADKKSWKDIAKATKQNPGQLRRLYNLGKKQSQS